ncbi:hypothetical protein E2C01_064399 [Portunus trituberculatus]|uniref:Uncharacterized protein n=1 Tax=Portunus trituberculatus TaxID=210409 RepID=A0A5B7HK83_PORTR|nr:hypothetical protein [Portunus trituberculatus]
MFVTVEESDEPTEEAIQCGGCEASADACHCQAITNTFTQVNRQLLELDLLERLAGDMISSQLLSTITSHVTSTCRDSYDQSRITQLEKVCTICTLEIVLNPLCATSLHISR